MKRLGARAGLFVSLLVLTDLILTLLYLNHVNEYAERLDQAKSDVGIVLFSGFEGESLGPETLRRVGFVSRMFAEGSFEYIFCAGGARPRRNLYGSELMEQWLLASGIPHERVFLEKRSNDTRSNLKESFDFARDMGWKRAWVVSSPLHIFRVKELTQKMTGPPSVFLAAYSYSDCRPAVHWTTLWWQTHYEWTSRLLERTLPARAYKKLIDFLRG